MSTPSAVDALPPGRHGGAAAGAGTGLDDGRRRCRSRDSTADQRRCAGRPAQPEPQPEPPAETRTRRRQGAGTQPALASGRRAWSCSTSGFCCSVSSGLSSLGPCAFFGRPGKPFELFRDIDGTFYADIVSTLVSLLG